jgi:hypothetical protein
MIQHIHDKSKGWVTYLVVGFLVIVFVMWGISYYLKGFNSPKADAGSVNGQTISMVDFNRAYESARSQEAGLLGDSAVQSLKAKVLNILMLKKLLSHSASEAGFYLSDEVLTGWILSDLTFKDAKGQFSPERYHLLLQQLGINSAMLMNQTRESVLIGQVQQGISQTAFALPYEINGYAPVIDPLVKATIVKIPASSFESKVEFSEEVLKAYYDQHAANFYGKKMVRLEYLELKTAAAYQSDRDKLANLTFENPDSLAVASQALNLPILKTGYFSAEGGDTPLTQNPAVLAVAFDPESLKSHANSDLISLSPTDAVVIRVIDEQSPRLKSFEEVKPEIQQLLSKQEAEKRAKIASEKLLEAKNFVEEAKSAGFTISPEQTYRENDKTVSPAIKKALFDGKVKKNRISLLDEDSGWVLIDFQSGENSKPSSTQIYESTIRLPGIWSAWEYRAYEDELIHDANIKTNL